MKLTIVPPDRPAQFSCPACDAPAASAHKRRGRACWYCDAPLSADDPPRVIAAKINRERPLRIGPSHVPA